MCIFNSCKHYRHVNTCDYKNLWAYSCKMICYVSHISSWRLEIGGVGVWEYGNTQSNVVGSWFSLRDTCGVFWFLLGHILGQKKMPRVRTEQFIYWTVICPGSWTIHLLDSEMSSWMNNPFVGQWDVQLDEQSICWTVRCLAGWITHFNSTIWYTTHFN